MNPFTYNQSSSGRFRRRSFRKRRFVRSIRNVVRRSGEKKYLIRDINEVLGKINLNHHVSICRIPQGVGRAQRVGNKVTLVGIYVNIQIILETGLNNAELGLWGRILILTNKENVRPDAIVPQLATTTYAFTRPFEDEAYIKGDQFWQVGQGNTTQMYAYKRFIKIPAKTIQYTQGSDEPQNLDFVLIVTTKGPVNNPNQNQVRIRGYTSVHYYDA